MLSWLGRTIYRFRWFTLIISLLILAGAVLYGTGLFGEMKSGGFTDPASQSTQAQKLLDTKLGGSAADIIILMRSDTLKATDPTFISAADDLFNRLKARSEVSSITSYYSTHSSNLLSNDGHETFAVVQLTAKDLQQKQKDYNAIHSLISSPTLQLSVGGIIPVNVAVNAQVGADLERAELITFPIVAILLFIVFGGLVAASLPLVIGGVAILGAFAVLRLLANITDISVYSVNVVTMLGLGLAIDYALFIVTRFREELAYDEADVKAALQRTMATAGRTVTFSGLTVSTSLLALLLFPESFLHSMGLGAIAAVLIAMIGSLTLLPALLAIAGRRINALSIRHLFRRNRNSLNKLESTEARGAWYRLSEAVMRWPVPIVLAVVALLLFLGTPFLHVQFATPDVRVLHTDQPARIVSDKLSQDFPQQGDSQLVIAISTTGSALSADNLASLDSYVRAIKAIPGVVRVDSLVTVNSAITLAQYQQLYAHPGTNPLLDTFAKQLANGNVTRITVALQPAERSTAAENIVTQIRALKISGLTPLVGGATPAQMDLLANLGSILPGALALMAGAILVLLFLMTGSILIPIKAIILNTLSLTATFGGLVWIFQDGHLQQLLDFQSTGTIDATQPVLIFAIAFGLSMDYEVFLLSRIKERFDETGDNRNAVASGIQRTGWLITSAAVLLAIVLGAFGSSKIIFIQEIGIGLAIAVLMDATLVRMLLVPATMRLLGKYNWWAPAPLQALWKRIGLSETSASVVKNDGIEAEAEREQSLV